jgi:hypothetical protein
VFGIFLAFIRASMNRSRFLASLTMAANPQCLSPHRMIEAVNACSPTLPVFKNT